MHDWERIVVAWRRENGEWRRNSLHMSYHAGYIYLPWNEIQNTFDYSDIGEQAGKDKDAAKTLDGRNMRISTPAIRGGMALAASAVSGNPGAGIGITWRMRQI